MTEWAILVIRLEDGSWCWHIHEEDECKATGLAYFSCARDAFNAGVAFYMQICPEEHLLPKEDTCGNA